MRAFERQLGPAREPSFADAVDPRDKVRVQDALDALTSGAEQRFDVRYRVVTPDGTVRWKRDRGRIQQVEDGSLRLVGVTSDLSGDEEMSGEPALDNRDQLLRQVMDAVPVMMSVVDSYHRLLFANAAYERHFGAGEDELRHRTVRDVFGEALYAEIEPKLEAALRGTAQSFELEMSDSSGSPRIFHVSYVPQALEDGARRVCTLSTDVTEQIALNRELQQKADALAEADRRKDEFLAMLSHELRNPLAPIRSALDGLQLKSGRSRSTELDILDRQVRHLTRLVDDLLEVERITHGTIRLGQKIVELRSLFDCASEVVEPFLRCRRQRLITTFPPADVRLRCDHDRLVQAIVNLLENASRYSPRGSRVWLSGEVAGDGVVIEVRDEGQGIELEQLDKIFDLFTQGARGLDRTQGGLGIGLTITRTLVNMHGGRVTVHSDGPGRGSEFTIWLPHGEAPKERSRSAEPGDQTAPKEGLDVLVVDDNEDLALMYAELLKVVGHSPRVAHDGLAALSEFERRRPDVAFVDIGLPKVDGLELARRFRRMDGQAFLVAISGYGQEADIAASSRAGFDDHLIKPVDWNKLREVLEGFSRRPR